MALAQALREEGSDDSDFSDFDSSQDGSEGSDDGLNSPGGKATLNDNDDESHKSVDTAILRPQNESLQHDVPAMLKVVQGGSTDIIAPGYRLGLTDWEVLWKCSYVAIKNNSIEEVMRPNEKSVHARDQPLVRSSRSADIRGSPVKLKSKGLFTTESSKANFENELSTFSVSSRPVSSPDLLPVAVRNFDPKHVYYVDPTPTVEANIESFSKTKSPNQWNHDVLGSVVRTTPANRRIDMINMLETLEKESISEHKQRRREAQLRKVQKNVVSRVAAVEEKTREYNTSKSVLKKIYDGIALNEDIKNENYTRERELMLGTSTLRAKLLMDIHVELTAREVDILMDKFDDKKTGYLNLYNVYGNAKLICGTPPKKRKKKKPPTLSQTLPRGTKRLTSHRGKIILPKLEVDSKNDGSLSRQRSSFNDLPDGEGDNASMRSDSTSAPAEQILLKLADYAGRQIKTSRTTSVFGTRTSSINKLPPRDFKHFVQEHGISDELSARELAIIEKKYSEGPPILVNVKLLLADLKILGQRRLKERDQELAMQSFIRVLSREGAARAFAPHPASEKSEPAEPPASLSFDDFSCPFTKPAAAEPPAPELSKEGSAVEGMKPDDSVVDTPECTPPPQVTITEEPVSSPVMGRVEPIADIPAIGEVSTRNNEEDITADTADVQLLEPEPVIVSTSNQEPAPKKADDGSLLEPPAEAVPEVGDEMTTPVISDQLVEEHVENRSSVAVDADHTEDQTEGAQDEVSLDSDDAGDPEGTVISIEDSAPGSSRVAEKTVTSVPDNPVVILEEEDMENLPAVEIRTQDDIAKDTSAQSTPAEAAEEQPLDASIISDGIDENIEQASERVIESMAEITPPVQDGAATLKVDTALMNVPGVTTVEATGTSSTEVAMDDPIPESSAANYDIPLGNDNEASLEAAESPSANDLHVEAPLESGLEKQKSFSYLNSLLDLASVGSEPTPVGVSPRAGELTVHTDMTPVDATVAPQYEVGGGVTAEGEEISSYRKTVEVVSEGDGTAPQLANSPEGESAPDCVFAVADVPNVSEAYSEVEASQILTRSDMDGAASNEEPAEKTPILTQPEVKQENKTDVVDPFNLLSAKMKELYSSGSHFGGSQDSGSVNNGNAPQIQVADDNSSVASGKGYVSGEKNVYDSQFLNLPPPESAPPPESPVVPGEGTHWPTEYHQDQGAAYGEEHHGYYAEDGTWVPYTEGQYHEESHEWTQEQIDEYYRQHPEELAAYNESQNSTAYGNHDSAVSGAVYDYGNHYDPNDYYDPNAHHHYDEDGVAYEATANDNAEVHYEQPVAEQAVYPEQMQYGSAGLPVDDYQHGDESHTGYYDSTYHSDGNYTEEPSYAPVHVPDPHTPEYYDWEQAHKPTSAELRKKEFSGMSLPGIYSDSDVMQRTASGYSINPLAGTGTSTGLNLYGDDENNSDDNDVEEAVNEFSTEMDPFMAISQPFIPGMCRTSSSGTGTDAEVINPMDYDKIDNRILYGGDTTDTDHDDEAADNFNPQPFRINVGAVRGVPAPVLESPVRRSDYMSPLRSNSSMRSTTSSLGEPIRRNMGGSEISSTAGSQNYHVDSVDLEDDDDSRSFY